MEKIELALERITEAVLAKVPSLLLAVVLLIVGSWLIRLILTIMRRRFERRNVDLSLRDFVASIVKIALYIMLILSVASMIGIQTTSFIAVLGAASLSIGLALQGSLSNFAGGMLILLFRPFRVGDYVSSATGASGTVERIDILYTTLRTAEGIAVFVPNGPLANSVVTNYSSISQRRIEYRIGISYESNIKEARAVILNVLAEDKRILKTPKPEVHVGELADSSVNLIIRAWAPKDSYWDAYYANFENIKLALDANNITIPYPQQEMRIVHMPDAGKAG
ncbi:mechanosensitive ion channel [Parapedobacter sp. ISTM3]|uniref:Small conductance mechanosensitive channel n=1 Tax=Parapedobacter luteus TaxID=623280 RepID=A0A1T5FF41_9SPHI|nr:MULTISPECIES: mechanosensitive ion channel domain-containing protein [Parapedobacter]MBK1441458.1 mechanosensitive ion channel [Parapedobacter sp. ISTM3]SKB94799.1 small conductance mechanosensitive channel [Parapedobacter luteus]